MATEKQANKARDEHAQMLKDMGAHAITIGEIDSDGKNSFAVIAMLDKEVAELPKSLEIKVGKKAYSVPLVGKVTSKFKLD